VDVGSLGAQFAGLDGVDQWAALSGKGGAPPRSELLHNIEGLDGTGVAVIRVGRYKLLHRMQSARGFDGYCDVCHRPEGCQTDDGRTVLQGGQFCCAALPTGNSTHCPPPPPSAPLPESLLFDIVGDPSETTDLAAAQPERVRQMLARLQQYNATSSPCCICTGSGATDEMDKPPREGYWTSFHDQSANPDPNCKLQAEPPWRVARGEEGEARISRANAWPV